MLQERGQTFVMPQETPKPVGELFGLHQATREDEERFDLQEHLPHYPRGRLLLKGNYKLIMKAEYLFFYLPTTIILGLCIPVARFHLFQELLFALRPSQPSTPWRKWWRQP